MHAGMEAPAARMEQAKPEAGGTGRTAAPSVPESLGSREPGRPRARKPRKPKKPLLDQRLSNLLSLLAGALVIAASFNCFLLPNGIASGGISGVSVLLQHLYGFTPAYVQWALNIPLFLAGMALLGRRFALQTLVGSAVLPLFVLLTAHWGAPTDNPLLASIYGGIGVGIGLGLVFRGRGSTGGTDLAAQILHRYTGLPLGLSVACMDGLVIAAAGLFLSPEKALYALIGLFVTSKTIDIVQTGLALSKVAFIISARSEELADAVLHDLDRGLTRLDAHGGFTGDARTVLMVVVSQNEVPELKRLVQQVDPNAFVIISHTAEVIGQGFKLEG
ncbi:YitT family protein [Paenibacillus albicereus]|uniref:YitT family protein n=2 Tax=Paenibacillus albicereus TaxID=2726185 RepID=A0A6H2H4C8_9BACL|nr:YitT family protein [Paenibacillus albicereus]QJC54522.1 YitT family protein [Paenibacillus albicereus]